jgi:hypothetical protein
MRILRPIRFSINGHPHQKMICHYERFNIWFSTLLFLSS